MKNFQKRGLTPIPYGDVTQILESKTQVFLLIKSCLLV